MEEKYPELLQAEVRYYKNRGYEIKEIKDAGSNKPGYEYAIIDLLVTRLKYGQIVIIQYSKNSAGETVNVVYRTVGKMKKIYKMIEQPKDEESEKLTASREEKREVKMTAAAGGSGAV